jgi:hypothetical protein
MTARVIILCFIAIASPLHAQLSLTTGAGCSEDGTTDHSVVPHSDILLGTDTFLPITDDVSLFLAAGGYFDYRYVVDSFRYVYDITLDLSCWMESVRIKPSIKAKGEQYYGDELSLPDEFSNAFDILFSFDFDRTTLSFSPGFEWKKNQYEAVGAAELTLALCDGFVLSGGVKAEKSIPGSLNDDLAVITSAKCSLYSEVPFTISAGVAHTFSESTYVYVPDSATSGIGALDYNEFSFTLDASTALAEFATLTLSTPVALRLKMHDAFSGVSYTDENEWLTVFDTKAVITFYAGEMHRFILSATGEWILSNSPYQRDHSFTVSIAYEFFFEPKNRND